MQVTRCVTELTRHVGSASYEPRLEAARRCQAYVSPMRVRRNSSGESHHVYKTLECFECIEGTLQDGDSVTCVAEYHKITKLTTAVLYLPSYIGAFDFNGNFEIKKFGTSDSTEEVTGATPQGESSTMANNNLYGRFLIIGSILVLFWY